MTAIAVTIAGSDSGGGAGIQADLKTFSALGVYGASVITALTAQNTLTVTGVHDVPPDFVRLQMDAVFGDLRVNATKIGMLSKPEIIRAVAGGLDALSTGPVVLDPVMVTSTGVVLISDEAIDTLKSELFPRCALITPNLHESARLLGASMAEDRDAMIRQAEGLLRLGARSVLLKGGHLPGGRASDLLADGERQVWLDAPMIATRHTHGTGCTLSAAIASGLALGHELGIAVAEAKSYLHGAIAAADTLDIGAGNGPVHHFWRSWPAK
ncbi:hydroxymethylpyrimidine kinase /phosphomethylpyrimidine kinase [Faunimonas pinastri]|uniref:hydroxymethylpyrimidine kinase n=1 Tax=Faunimonas pinastri TaxID=1855383 RepID=A0A1H9FCW3_9HYPH|nr:bifunctional hydroxymethylpyrimidine kinase/phosphomethylpyrimidine kinase [Faunimonas pinastri]SEQ35742.1 hydroxymethylpyrimidine kinase /phosphomethylpyrimidine kinase [Faunimonas pinastri]